jgi:hypothetical protein
MTNSQHKTADFEWLHSFVLLAMGRYASSLVATSTTELLEQTAVFAYL